MLVTSHWIIVVVDVVSVAVVTVVVDVVAVSVVVVTVPYAVVASNQMAAKRHAQILCRIADSWDGRG